MAKYDLPSGQDSLDYALRQLAELDNRVQALEGRRLSTWDRADHTTIPAPVEGQHLVNMSDESIRYYSNGVWRTPGFPIEFFQATGTGSALGTSLTAISFTDISGFSSGDYMDVNAGNIRILDAGVYLFKWYTSSWTLTVNVASWVEGTVNVTSGSTGNWDTQFGANEVYFQSPLRIDDADANFDIQFDNMPEAAATAAWASTATFPVVIETKMLKLENGSGVADNIDVRVSVTRLGPPFE